MIPKIFAICLQSKITKNKNIESDSIFEIFETFLANQEPSPEDEKAILLLKEIFNYHIKDSALNESFFFLKIYIYFL